MVMVDGVSLAGFAQTLLLALQHCGQHQVHHVHRAMCSSGRTFSLITCPQRTPG